MTDYKPPLSIFFVWHPADKTKVKPLFDFCFRMLQRDVEKPFSRSMNLPIFFRTSTTNEIPSTIISSSKKVLIFAFLSLEVAADCKWTDYLKTLLQTNDARLIPIALDKNAFSLNNILNGSNFIRMFEYQEEYKEAFFFINVAHEIYRYALNNNFDSEALGKTNAIKLFLSHSKWDDWAVKLTNDLKNIIDSSAMRSFFDAPDIAPGYKFCDEIEGHIKESTVITIHSDSYSSRYWCQREIISAKDLKRPIVAVDCLSVYEDRRFTYSANIPAIHVSAQDITSKGVLLKILSFALLETVRLNYNMILLESYKECGWISKDTILMPRPPEASDVLGLIKEELGNYTVPCNCIVYPEPAVYTEEHNLVHKLNIKTSTPLNFDSEALLGLSIGLSISAPIEEELTEIGQDSCHLKLLSQEFAKHLLARKIKLIYGGDLRPDGFTKFIFEEAAILQDRLKTNTIQVDNYIAWPIYVNDTSELKSWKAKYRVVASMIELPPPSDVLDLIPDRNSFLHPSNPNNKFVWSRCLTEMRKEMIHKCTMRICAGGTHCGYKGIMPGVLEEIIIAIEMKKPLYLLGGFGGVTSTICQLLKSSNIQTKITREWQILNNAGYNDLLNFATNRDVKFSADYDEVTKTIAEYGLEQLSKNNGLTKSENFKLFETPFIDEALYLIIKGLKIKNTEPGKNCVNSLSPISNIIISPNQE
jgi:hypothetical protein